MSLSGILVLDKPAGPTSHDMVDRVRSRLRLRKVGHTGTLDPFATGVLPICVGRATRIARFLAASDKAYVAGVRFGFATTTDDLAGDPLDEPRGAAPDAEALAGALAGLLGEIVQRPPTFSAKRVAGRRSYERARAGEVVEAQPVRVFVHRLELVGVEADRAEIEVECSAGTYVRALARDLGETLGCGAHLVSLRRTRAAGFGLDEALPDGFDRDAARKALIPLDRTLLEMPGVVLSPEGVAAVRHGRDVTAELAQGALPAPLPARARLLDGDGHLLALAIPHGAALHPDVVLG